MNGQGTNTGAALKYTRERIFSGSGDRSNAKNVAVLFTDGGSQDKRETILQANRAKAAGIHIVTVGIGNPGWLDQWELRGIASWPYERNYIYVHYYRDLNKVRTRLRELICDSKFPFLLFHGIYVLNLISSSTNVCILLNTILYPCYILHTVRLKSHKIR